MNGYRKGGYMKGGYMKGVKYICAALIIVPLGQLSAAEDTAMKTHKKVQAALDWQLPVNICKVPKPPGKRKRVTDDQNTREEWDVDSYTLGRYQRKENRWKKCVENYKSGLLKEFDTLKNSAEFGLTQQQADIILGKMAQIQEVITSPEGALLFTELPSDE